MRDLNGKVAWITGAGTGIGSGAAIALASAGMQVVLSGRREEKLKEVAAACHGNAHIEILDVANKDDVRVPKCDELVSSSNRDLLPMVGMSVFVFFLAFYTEGNFQSLLALFTKNEEKNGNKRSGA